MPQLILSIDDIAIKENRDVLFLRFPEIIDKINAGDDKPDYENYPLRGQIVVWLEQQGVGHHACCGFPSNKGWHPRTGDLYLDVPFDREDPTFKKLSDKLEYEDGKTKIPGIEFQYYPLNQG